MDMSVMCASFFEFLLWISASEASSGDVNNIISSARSVDRMWIKKLGVGITVERVPKISTGDCKWG